jgi:hypothetical protein
LILILTVHFRFFFVDHYFQETRISKNTKLGVYPCPNPSRCGICTRHIRASAAKVPSNTQAVVVPGIYAPLRDSTLHLLRTFASAHRVHSTMYGHTHMHICMCAFPSAHHVHHMPPWLQHWPPKHTEHLYTRFSRPASSRVVWFARMSSAAVNQSRVAGVRRTAKTSPSNTTGKSKPDSRSASALPMCPP